MKLRIPFDRWRLFLMPVAWAACASLETGDEGQGRVSRISAEEIEGSGMVTVTAYELIERLRPRWLQRGTARSVGLSTVIAVYQDGRRMGGPEELRQIPVSAVSEIRYLDASEAGRLPGIGSDHVEGAIVVVTESGESSRIEP